MQKNSLKPDVCIIGAGSGGLSVAAGAAQLGLQTVLIEKGEMGGDCLNTGCVPSKALLAAAKRAQLHRKDDIPGIAAHEPDIDFAGVQRHVADTIRAIAPNDSQERFEGLGVCVIRAAARFLGPDRVEADGQSIRARRFVVAAGSRAAIPPIPGIVPERTLTNETVFALQERPQHLLVIGGGPIGIELAQAHRRLGSEVSVFDLGPILPRDDPANVRIVREQLREEGVELYEEVSIREVRHTDAGVSLIVDHQDRQLEISGSHLLAAAGRRPNLEGLELERAGVACNDGGIQVDARLRTSNSRIFAIGDIAGGPQFTHVAGYQAGIIIRQICFRMFWSRVDYKSLPWVTYCDPELAQAGLTEAEARERHGDGVRVTEWEFADNDRAITEGTRRGQLRLVTDRKGRILGASLVGPQAGELIGIWSLAISAGLRVSALAGMIAPYPTLGEISKRAAGAWYSPTLFSDRTRRLVRLLQWLP